MTYARDSSTKYLVSGVIVNISTTTDDGQMTYQLYTLVTKVTMSVFMSTRARTRMSACVCVCVMRNVQMTIWQRGTHKNSAKTSIVIINNGSKNS